MDPSIDTPFVIEVENVSKMYSLEHRSARTLKQAAVDLVRRRQAPDHDFWALKDVSFQVRRGDTVGIIGANGAGKSTLLAMISGTIQPSSGAIRTHGKMSSLLELGAGFHPDLTGRENVFLYGAIMGLSRRQMERRFDKIIEFAELEKWIDEPVKHYSSGMYVRLGFAVAVEVDPDVLIIDEVLAVGDARFQMKCLERIRDFKRRAKTLLVVSHDLGTVHNICDQVILMEKGRVAALGEPHKVIVRYERSFADRIVKVEDDEWGTGEVKLTHVEFLDERGQPTDTFYWDRPLDIRIHYKAEHPIADPVFGFAITSTRGLLIYGSNTQIENYHIPRIEGEGSVRLHFDRVTMGRGKYVFSFSSHSQDHRTNYHRLDNAFPITVETDNRFEGCCHMPIRWSI